MLQEQYDAMDCDSMEYKLKYTVSTGFSSSEYSTSPELEWHLSATKGMNSRG